VVLNVGATESNPESKIPPQLGNVVHTSRAELWISESDMLGNLRGVVSTSCSIPSLCSLLSLPKPGGGEALRAEKRRHMVSAYRQETDKDDATHFRLYSVALKIAHQHCQALLRGFDKTSALRASELFEHMDPLARKVLGASDLHKVMWESIVPFVDKGVGELSCAESSMTIAQVRECRGLQKQVSARLRFAKERHAMIMAREGFCKSNLQFEALPDTHVRGSDCDYLLASLLTGRRVCVVLKRGPAWAPVATCFDVVGHHSALKHASSRGDAGRRAAKRARLDTHQPMIDIGTKGKSRPVAILPVDRIDLTKDVLILRDVRDGRIRRVFPFVCSR
jgi:hypothetical protein